jgi:hypothetical protein
VRPGTQKAKGNSAERKIARLLSVWYYDDPDVLIRAPSSGTLGTLRQGAVPCGDILQVGCPDQPFPYSVEVKHRAQPVWASDLLQPTSSHPFWQGWRQAERDAASRQLVPVLIYIGNYRPPLVAVPRLAAAARRWDVGLLFQDVWVALLTVFLTLPPRL